MAVAEHASALSKPRWDGSRVLFEIGSPDDPVRCAISRTAIQELTGRRHFAPTDLMRIFDAARKRIEAIAIDKIKARPESAAGIVSIWADDIDDPPSAPAVAQAATEAPVEGRIKGQVAESDRRG